MKWWLTACLLLPWPAHAAAVFLDRFESPVTAWQVLGEQASIDLQTDEAYEGQALRFQYQRSTGLAACFTLLQAPPTGARAVRLQVRTATPTLLYLAVYEADDSGYGTMLTVDAGAWQQVELSFDRFRLAEDKVDENGQLDVHQIAGLGLTDLSAFGFGRFERDGAQTIWLDDVSLTTDLVPSAYSQAGELPYTLDNFDCVQRQWLALEGDLLHLPAAGTLSWNYPAGPPTETGLAALIGAVGRLPATGATHLLLTLSSERHVLLAVVFQEEKRPADGRDESRYYATCEVPGGGQPTTVAVALADLVLDTNNGGGDENSRFDLDQVSMLTIADVEAIFAQHPGPNTIVLEAVELVHGD